MINLVNWLLPKEKKFFLMLKDQASNVVDGSNEFKNFIHNYNALNEAKKRDFVKRIKEIESRGDNITHNIIGSLDKTFITPIDKEDIHKLAMLLDDVIDFIYATSIRLTIFKISRIDDHIKKLTDIVIEIIEKIELGIIGVSKLRTMNRFYIDIHTLENKADDIYHEALDDLFNKKNPIEIIKYREIYEYLENITDKCEDIANVIESIVVKHA
ncbi:MAG: DUF47 domain-containing protein [Nanoarchaeota archaeon]|nr:DUF47 domain-containing protein [Nanoarchaeota archaeon]